MAERWRSHSGQRFAVTTVAQRSPARANHTRTQQLLCGRAQLHSSISSSAVPVCNLGGESLDGDAERSGGTRLDDVSGPGHSSKPDQRRAEGPCGAACRSLDSRKQEVSWDSFGISTSGALGGSRRGRGQRKMFRWLQCGLKEGSSGPSGSCEERVALQSCPELEQRS